MSHGVHAPWQIFAGLDRFITPMEIYGALSAKPKNSNLRKWPYDPESCHLDSIPGMPFWFQVEKVRQASANPAQVLSLLSLAPFLHFSWFATAKQPSFFYKHTGWRWSGRSWSCRARNSHEELDFEGLTCSCSPMVFLCAACASLNHSNVSVK